MPQQIGVVITRLGPNATLVVCVPQLFTDADLAKLIHDLQREEVAGRLYTATHTPPAPKA